MRDRPDRRFTFRLALALGMTVEEMLDRMTWREYLDWTEYYGLEPWGEEPPAGPGEMPSRRGPTGSGGGGGGVN